MLGFETLGEVTLGEIKADATSASVTLAAGAGAFAITGTAAFPEHGYVVAAGAGAFTYSGADATLTPGGAGPGSSFWDWLITARRRHGR